MSERREIDWAEVRGRVAAITRRMEEAGTLTADEGRRVLERRARELARSMEAPAETGERLEVVEFLLAYERYGIETRYVREIYPLTEFTPLPGAPEFLLGIANVRGQIVSVVDLKRLFDLPAKGLTNLNQLIVVRSGEMEMGVLADEMLSVRSVAMEELMPPLPTMTGIRREYLRGVTGERLAVLDMDRILNDPEIVVGRDRNEKGRVER